MIEILSHIAMLATLNVAQICPATRALGPGKRFVIWVQGCPFNCLGCIAPDWIPIKLANLISVEQMAERILDVTDLEGITLSGGEPMLQAGALSELIHLLRASKDSLSAIAFSGFTLEQLRKKRAKDRAIDQLLSQLDVLIDGLYIGDLNVGKGLRGSRNQRVHFLSDRYVELREEFENGPRHIELHVSESELLLTGIPTAESLKAFQLAVEQLRGRIEQGWARGS